MSPADQMRGEVVEPLLGAAGTLNLIATSGGLTAERLLPDVLHMLAAVIERAAERAEGLAGAG
ncbi:hypothetical protein GVO57_09385 [Sphingomonas changnyeongensis]|uniref:Uncharacterized protein n=1 Tax=Sphingomonas changnyeongensis TaxID=2698679 RepID=A0A7Z2NXD7_9SPHN|nr:hypothetical protein [Sphingomonas changnyeongensis]QHL90994.1 hypothetical protein GVO57_09385 [Sphingomonas changnyeongensis]